MSRRPPRPAWGRWAAGILLAAAILWMGAQSELLFAAFTRGWQALFGALGLGDLLARIQHNTSSQLTMRSLPAMLTYGVLYVVLCLLLLRVLLGDVRLWYQALAVYGLVLGLCGLLLLLGKLGGNVVVLYRVARQLIDFLTSPLPLLLAPLLSPAIRRSLLPNR